MAISLREHPTLAMRLGPMAESRLYKIAHPAIFCDLSFVRLIHTNRIEHFKEQPGQSAGLCIENAIMRHRRSARRPACPKQLGRMGNDPTTWRIVLTSVWCRHADVEGISPASRRMFAARKRVQRRLRKGGPYRTGF
jgi:hypothetical protein